jgi:hypothetical protein
MYAILCRNYQKFETPGSLYLIDQGERIYECKTLELQYLDNKRNVSCIPAGSYIVTKYSYSHYQNTFLINGVPDRDGILMHKGNFAAGNKIDTQGCILLGTGFELINQDTYQDIKGCDIALACLNLYLPESFMIHII